MNRNSILPALVVSLLSQLSPAVQGQEKQIAQGLGMMRGSHTRHYAAVDFGKKGQRRIWLAVDGPFVLVDQNADGELSDSGESVRPNDRGDFVTDVCACVGSGWSANFVLRFSLGKDRKGQPGIKALSVHPKGDIQQFHCTAGFIPLGRTRSTAPILPIHGPLRFVLMDHWTGSTACRVLPRNGGRHEFSILVATPVRGIKGEAYVYPNLWPLEGKKLPTLKLEFELRKSRSTTSPQLRVWQCECARRYRCSVTCPPASVALRARLHVSFPGWRHGPLEPATFFLDYAEPSTSKHVTVEVTAGKDSSG